jgi:cell division protein ZipA
MEFGTREILIILGVLVVLAIALDGLRRASRSRSGKLRASKRKQPIFDDDDLDDYGSELPGGGARVVAVRDEEKAAELSQRIRQDTDLASKRYTSAFLARTFSNSEQQQVPVETQPEPEASLSEAEVAEQADARAEQTPPAPQRLPEKPVPSPSFSNAAPAAKPSASSAAVNNDDVVILHLMAKKGETFAGDELLRQLLDHHLRYGAMKIFHRHEGEDGSGPIHFSVANSLNPGTFDLATMEQFATPGITFLMPLHDLTRPMASFELLIQCASSLAKKLEGELKDETRSALTRQTVEHYKQRIIDYTRRSFTLTTN